MGYRKYTLNENFFEVINSEKKAYFLGLLYADGYNNSHGKSKFISLQLQERDKQILELFKKSINSNCKLHFICRKSDNHQNCYRLQLNSKKLSNDLTNAGCWQNKSLILIFPKISINLIPHFIRGYFDGDGCVWEGKRKIMKVKDLTKRLGFRYRIVHNVKFNITGTVSIINWIQNILVKNLCFKKNKLNTSKKITNCIQLEYSGRIQMKKFYDFMYKNSSVYLSRKKEKFENILNLC